MREQTHSCQVVHASSLRLWFCRAEIGVCVGLSLLIARVSCSRCTGSLYTDHDQVRIVLFLGTWRSSIVDFVGPLTQPLKLTPRKTKEKLLCFSVDSALKSQVVALPPVHCSGWIWAARSVSSVSRTGTTPANRQCRGLQVLASARSPVRRRKWYFRNAYSWITGQVDRTAGDKWPRVSVCKQLWVIVIVSFSSLQMRL